MLFLSVSAAEDPFTFGNAVFIIVIIISLIKIWVYNTVSCNTVLKYKNTHTP